MKENKKLYASAALPKGENPSQLLNRRLDGHRTFLWYTWEENFLFLFLFIYFFILGPPNYVSLA